MQDGDRNLILSEMKDWRRIVFEVVGIPEPVFKEFGISGFMLSLPVGEADTLQPYQAQIEELCQSAPHISALCISLISRSYGAMALMLSRAEDIDPVTFKKALVDFSVAKGAVLAMLPQSPMLIAHQTKAKQMHAVFHKKYSSLGGEAKAKHTNALKSWALEEAKKMTGRIRSDNKLADDLIDRAPRELTHDEFGYVRSKNPRRTIYEALLARHKNFSK